MLVSTYFCDSCKLEFDRTQVHDVTIQVYMRCHTSAVHVTKHICTDCLEKKGFVQDRYESEANRKTLKERAVELLSDLGVSFNE